MYQTGRQRLHEDKISVLSCVQIPVWVFDVDAMCMVWANKPGVYFWNADNLETLLERDMSEGMSNTVKLKLKQTRDDCQQTGKTVSELWTVYPNGSPQTAEIVIAPIELEDGRAALLIQRVNAVNGATSNTLHSAQALLHTSTMISMYDKDYNRVYSNPAARAASMGVHENLRSMFVFQGDFEDVISSLFHQGECTVEAEVRTQKGNKWHSISVQMSPDSVTGNTSILVSSIDITSRRNAQQKAHDLAYLDSLTGLSNRFALLEHLNVLARNPEKPFSLYFIDLDRFKVINDSLGHRVGDSLLIEVAKRLSSSESKDQGLVGRLGGDEFIVVTPNLNEADKIKDHVINIDRLLNVPFNIEGHQLHVVPSIGVCQFPQHGANTTDLMRNADLAMYAAKAANGGYRFFDESMKIDAMNRLSIENELAVAITENQFEVYYQPKICSYEDKVAGMEALVRWNHPERGLVSPLEFISVAEETGLISKIGAWVMNESMNQQKSWQDAGFDLCVSINISPVQFRSNELKSVISNALVRSQCDPSRIEVEITESMLLGDADLVFDTLTMLNEKGVQISLDDFGTGYSNLAYLQKYPLSCMKIDKAFLDDMSNTGILEMILGMGKMLGLRLVAEGVETLQQAQWLREHQCDELQGFYFGKPMPKDEATRYLVEFQSNDKAA